MTHEILNLRLSTLQERCHPVNLLGRLLQIILGRCKVSTNTVDLKLERVSATAVLVPNLATIVLQRTQCSLKILQVLIALVEAVSGRVKVGSQPCVGLLLFSQLPLEPLLLVFQVALQRLDLVAVLPAFSSELVPSLILVSTFGLQLSHLTGQIFDDRSVLVPLLGRLGFRVAQCIDFCLHLLRDLHSHLVLCFALLDILICAGQLLQSAIVLDLSIVEICFQLFKPISELRKEISRAPPLSLPLQLTA